MKTARFHDIIGRRSYRLCPTNLHFARGPNASYFVISGGAGMCHTSGRRFGELLGKLVKLSQHDVEEILEDQTATHRRFGDIALSWGLCEPEHVWQAWSDQLLTQVQQVDLEKLGVDSQAAGMIQREVALKLCAIPIRCLGHHLIIAVGENNI